MFTELNEELSNTLSNFEVTPMIHYYRAEIGKLAVFKQRIDNTVNWTITCNLFFWSLYIQGKISIYITFAFTLLVTLVFHFIDIRRYIAYEILKYRCSLMEQGMYTEILSEGSGIKNWKNNLIKSWFQSTHISKQDAFLIRLRNLYAYIYFTHISLLIILHFI